MALALALLLSWPLAHHPGWYARRAQSSDVVLTRSGLVTALSSVVAVATFHDVQLLPALPDLTAAYHTSCGRQQHLLLTREALHSPGHCPPADIGSCSLLITLVLLLLLLLQVDKLVSLFKEKQIGVVAHFYMDPEVQGVLSAAAEHWPHVAISDSLLMADTAVKMAVAGCK